MNVFNYSLAILVLWLAGCTPEPQPEAEVTGPVQWVTYKGQEGPGNGKHIVFVSGDEEYRSEEALPQLARILSEHHGFESTVLFAQNPEQPGLIDPNYRNNIPGLDALDDADLLFLFTRFRDLPDEQMENFKEYLMGGKPLVAIRTATHAFQFEDSTSAWAHWSNFHEDANSPWDGGFGRLVLGERWHTHHGHHKHQSTRGLIAEEANDHPVVNGIDDGEIWGPTDVYGIRMPLPEGFSPIILGQVIDRAGEFDESDPFFGMQPSDSDVASVNPAARAEYNPNDPLMPVAWTMNYQLPEGQPGMSFTSTIGSSTDVVNEGVRRLLVNSVFYMLDMDVPEEADVAFVGDYSPSAYSFHTDEYWQEKGLMVSDYQ